MHKLITLGASGAIFSTLAACGGGSTGSDGGSGGFVNDPTDVAADAVPATGADNLGAAATFPLYYTLNVEGDTQASLQTGVGAIEVIDADTVNIILEAGDDPVEFSRIIDDEFEGSVEGEPVRVNISTGSGTVLAYAATSSGGLGFGGIYGFETPVDNLPSGTATYDSAGLATAFVATTGDPSVLQVLQPSATNPSLTVDFATSAVTGTLFDGTALIDLADDGTADDLLAVQVGIANGAMNDGTLSGNVTLAATVDVGGDIADLDPNVSASVVDGRVFGSTGNVIGGTFEATADFDIGDTERLDGVVGGTFFTVD